MGRHRKQSPVTIRRSSVIALTGLVPAGLASVTAAAANSGGAEQVSYQHSYAGAEQSESTGPIAVATRASSQAIAAALTRPAPAKPPIVKSVALPEGRQSADVPAGPLGMPGVAMAAYQAAERTLAKENPVCEMPWSMLAGIGQVESHHGYGKVDAEGYPLSPIYGPVLDGSLSGNHVVHETDGGELDGGMQTYARAVGPMQFLPETWRHFAADGNGDGIADPQNMFDAALTAGKYLCDGGLNMRDPAQQTKAILRYNNSMAYVANVMAWEAAYGNGLAPKPWDLPKI
ncbi:lytic transglycosylase [Nocardia panacis]|uniref:Lytic transglycosylase n=1 Tax=Nocardia panacis TaxID=2340916 RepID=A0A3A4L1S7_9NOCA|nr:lytic murein transglycosylase [Nocardia panacis]RJO80385.1 lytic transglycosylase [Nocardia panacis]